MTSARTIQDTLCDTCLTLAHDHSLEDHTTQIAVMRDSGAELRNHLCLAAAEPEIFPTCACGCNR